MRGYLIASGMLLVAACLLLGQSIPFPGPGGIASTPTNAAFVGSASCSGALPAASCTASGLSIPSGDIIVCGVATTSAGFANTCSDSNSDAVTCATDVHDGTNANDVQLCVLKAGATVTTITCTPAFNNQALACVFAWYSPGSLTATIDKSTGQDQPSTTTWTTGNTATLAGSNDLVTGMWGTAAGGITSTYSDGGTGRVTCPAQYSCALEDRNVSGTAAVAASGTFSAGGTSAAVTVMAIK